MSFFLVGFVGFLECFGDALDVSEEPEEPATSL